MKLHTKRLYALLFILFLTISATMIALVIYEKPVNSVAPEVIAKSKKNGLPVGIGIRYYSDLTVTTLISRGDILLLPVNRQDAEVPVTQKSVSEAIKTLNATNTLKTRAEKTIMFSSVEDLQTYANQIPQDVTWVFYDLERSMTPAKDLQNIPLAVKQFSDIVHSKNFKFGFGPTHIIYDGLERNGKITEILGYVDMVTYQGQNVASNMSRDMFMEYIKAKSDTVHSFNAQNGSNVKFYLQLWYPQQTTEDMVTIFNQLYSEGTIDYGGTGGQMQTSELVSILRTVN